MRAVLHAARAAVDPSPSDAQKEAGNYRKGHLRYAGLDLALENPRGSIRSGVSKDGTRWQNQLAHDYGYIKGSVGRDKDHVDCFIGHDHDSDLAFIVNQQGPTGRFDEHKVMLGFPTLPAAFEGYRANYSPGWRVGPITVVTLPELHYWLDHGDTTEPLPEWHRPCLWAGPDDGPPTLVLKAEGAIKNDPKNYLGVDRVGRAHWRAPWVSEQHAFTWGKPGRKPDTTTILPLNEYDHVIVSFSGGKDSIASVLHLLELGVKPEKIELWHQAIDGEPGSPAFMDWPVTDSYVRAFAQALGLKLRFQWKQGGFRGEMMRENAPTLPNRFELESGTIGSAGGKGPFNTRLKFPQASPDLKVRWCSAYLKIQVAEAAIRNDPRFNVPGVKVLYTSGERREESNNRANYAEAVRHGTSTQTRRVDHWRPVIDWSEEQVWEAMRRWGIRPHPAYELGWGRLSCMSCIFGDKDQWAAVQAVDPARFNEIAELEKRFGLTINRKGRAPNVTKVPVGEMAAGGTSLAKDAPPELVKLALGHDYDPREILVGKNWQLPRGAFQKTAGPT